MKIISVTDLETLTEMWAQGETINDIATELGLTSVQVGGLMDRLRGMGYALPKRNNAKVRAAKALEDFRQKHIKKD